MFNSVCQASKQEHSSPLVCQEATIAVLSTSIVSKLSSTAAGGVGVYILIERSKGS